MKTLIIFLFSFCIVISAPAQKHYNLDIKTEQDCQRNSLLTKDSATYKGLKYPVYTTASGKLFIILPNKTKNGYYRKYIKTSVY